MVCLFDYAISIKPFSPHVLVISSLLKRDNGNPHPKSRFDKKIKKGHELDGGGNLR